MVNHVATRQGERDDLPSRGVYTVKHWYDQRRIVYLERAVETNNLKDGSKCKGYKCENWRGMSQLIPSVLV